MTVGVLSVGHVDDVDSAIDFSPAFGFEPVHKLALLSE